MNIAKLSEHITLLRGYIQSQKYPHNSIKENKMLDKKIEENYSHCIEQAKLKNKLHSNCVLDALNRISWSNSLEELEMNTQKCLDWINKGGE